MYCDMYMEFLKLFIHLGKAIKFAFSGEFRQFYFVDQFIFSRYLDIHEKATCMLKN